MDIEHVEQKLSGWGRYPVETCRVYRAERRHDLAEILGSQSSSSYLPRGLGRSYGDAALNRNAGVISLRRLNRFLSLDLATGVVECEAGVTFEELLRHLLPRGLFPAVTPGTKYVTVGGAIAADVHGKNHHRDGSLATFVEAITLLTPEGELARCSREAHSDLFWATVGGMGLTGVIVAARMRMRRVETAFMETRYIKTTDLANTLDTMRTSDQAYEYSVAWVDCLSSRRALGRGVVMQASHAPLARLRGRTAHPLSYRWARSWNVPFDLPFSVASRPAARVFNSLRYRLGRTASARVVSLERFFYPLDRLQAWNRLYGPPGFVQYQLALPSQHAESALVSVFRTVYESGVPCFIAVLKSFGKPSGGYLSFPLEGYTLAMDFPFQRGIRQLFKALDQIVLLHEGRVYLAKDAMLEPESLERMYPALDDFRRIKRSVDPHLLVSSSLARRLRILSPSS